ncbi:MAG: sensor histidine kinase [Proteobacteria bacterium]|nr:sensor histidine kinase [Pseudomonadota bacterium]MCP4922307.1 sensor histidine kinase [Pseudomonadota bacterium]
MKALWSTRAALTVWLPLAATAALHYLSPPDAHWVHDVARRLFYVPILLAGAYGGVRGGLLAATVAIALYVPHAFLSGHAHHIDPGTQTEKLLEIGFYLVIGGVSGFLSEREQARRDELHAKDALLTRAARLEALGELSAGLAHEIRNPLHAMRGTAEILLDAVPEGAPEERLGQAHIAEIDRLGGVLKRFLTFAREPVVDVSGNANLEAVVARVADLVRAQAGRDGVELVTQPGGRTARGDEEQLTQVVLALALNGLQATGEGGRLELAASGLELTVTNTGAHIADGDLERVFDPFFTTRAEGTGLGLSVAWRIVEAHGGQLTAENVEGGVRFRVALPA